MIATEGPADTDDGQAARGSTASAASRSGAAVGVPSGGVIGSRSGAIDGAGATTGTEGFA